MVEHFFNRHQTTQRMRSGLLGPYVDGFAERLSKQGYKRDGVSRKIRLIADLSRWLARRRLGLAHLNEPTVGTFLRRRQVTLRHYCGERGALRMFLAQLRDLGVIPAPAAKVDMTEREEIARDFAQYLLQERGLAPLTANDYVACIRRFLADRFGAKSVRCDVLGLSDISQHILRRSKTCKPSSFQSIATALRAFFRFLYLRGSISVNLASAVPRVTSWRLTSVPKFLKPEQVESLLQCTNQNTTLDQRDYTVLLLLSRLGLRAGEVVRMRLDDIDWDVGELMVRGKAGQHDRLPMPVDVGEALATYLRHGRPPSSTRHVFVRMNAPHRGFVSSAAITYLVSKALHRAGLDPVHKGARILRHSLATQMLRQGASLAQVGEVLRHRCADSTEIYAKVDLNALRKLAQPWPGGKA